MCLLGSLAILVLGMKMMTEALQKVLGDRLRMSLEKAHESKVKGIFNGFFTTTLIQSSSATILVTVSLVNVGLLTLTQAGSVILGANVGTTFSSWMFALIGVKSTFNIAYFIPVFAVGVPFFFMKSKKLKFVGEAIIGFALLFSGIQIFMSLIEQNSNSAFYQFLQDYNGSLMSSISFIVVGAIISFVLQSTAVAIAFTQILTFCGVINMETALVLVLGHNLGSIINAELTVMSGNVHAKRAARIHSIFNIVGVLITFLLLPFIFDCFNQEAKENAPLQLAFFHTAYNVANVVLGFFILPVLVKLATESVKSKGSADEEYHLEFMDNGLITSPEISINEAKKELVKFAALNKEMNCAFRKLLKEQEQQVFEDLILTMRKQEDITDNMEEEITNFLTKVSQGELSEENSIDIRRIIGMVSDLEQIADIYYGMALIMERKKENKVWFIQEQRDCLNNMLDKLDKAFDILILNLNSEQGEVTLTEAKNIEAEIDALRDKAQLQHIESMEKGSYSFKSGMHYKDLYANFERIGDYVMKVNEALLGKK